MMIGNAPQELLQLDKQLGQRAPVISIPPAKGGA